MNNVTEFTQPEPKYKTIVVDVVSILTKRFDDLSGNDIKMFLEKYFGNKPKLLVTKNNYIQFTKQAFKETYDKGLVPIETDYLNIYSEEDILKLVDVCILNYKHVFESTEFIKAYVYNLSLLEDHLLEHRQLFDSEETWLVFNQQAYEAKMKLLDSHIEEQSIVNLDFNMKRQSNAVINTTLEEEVNKLKQYIDNQEELKQLMYKAAYQQCIQHKCCGCSESQISRLKEFTNMLNKHANLLFNDRHKISQLSLDIYAIQDEYNYMILTPPYDLPFLYNLKQAINTVVSYLDDFLYYDPEIDSFEIDDVEDACKLLHWQASFDRFRRFCDIHAKNPPKTDTMFEELITFTQRKLTELQCQYVSSVARYNIKNNWHCEHCGCDNQREVMRPTRYNYHLVSRDYEDWDYDDGKYNEGDSYEDPNEREDRILSRFGM